VPAFDFRCLSCDTTFEVEAPFGTKPQPSCPECGHEQCKRVFSPVGVVFKGSGFHNTDYKPRPKEDSGGCPSSGSTEKCKGCPASSE